MIGRLLLGDEDIGLVIPLSEYEAKTASREPAQCIFRRKNTQAIVHGVGYCLVGDA